MRRLHTAWSESTPNLVPCRQHRENSSTPSCTSERRFLHKRKGRSPCFDEIVLHQPMAQVTSCAPGIPSNLITASKNMIQGMNPKLGAVLTDRFQPEMGAYDSDSAASDSEKEDNDDADCLPGNDGPSEDSDCEQAEVEWECAMSRPSSSSSSPQLGVPTSQRSGALGLPPIFNFKGKEEQRRGDAPDRAAQDGQSLPQVRALSQTASLAGPAAGFRSSPGSSPGTGDAGLPSGLGASGLKETPSTPIPWGKNSVVGSGGSNPSTVWEKQHGRQYHVTCKAWCIVDCSTGKVVNEHEGQSCASPASLTKMMTTLLVLNITKGNKKKLRERVRVTLRSSAMGGTTAAIRMGEVYRVIDLLYGVMLPSGNDAATLLAEHYGRKMPGPSDMLPHKRFVAAMNRMAQSLGLHSTHFHNPHGLFHIEHHSTAADMVQLMREATKDAFYRKIVATRRHSCTTYVPKRKQRGKKVKPRKQVFLNTNQLLWEQGIDTWEGGKTGWLGNVHGQKVYGCLACMVQRGQHQLAAVLFGAEGRSQRFADMKRLVARTCEDLADHNRK